MKHFMLVVWGDLDFIFEVFETFKSWHGEREGRYIFKKKEKKASWSVLFTD